MHNRKCVRPSNCTRCNAKKGIHVHSSYARKCVFIGQKWLHSGAISIHRFRCAACGKVISVFPAFLCKYGRVDQRCMEQFLLKTFDLHPLKGALKAVFSNNIQISERTARRWKSKWKRLICDLKEDVLRFMLNIIPNIDMEIPRKSQQLRFLTKCFENIKSKHPQFKVTSVCGIILKEHYKSTFFNIHNYPPQNLSTPANNRLEVKLT